MMDVYSPVRGFTGTVAGVAFADGVARGVTSSAALAYFARHGYRLDTGQATTAEPAKPVRPDQRAKVAEWRAYAATLARTKDEADAIAKMGKADVIALVDAIESGVGEQGVDPVEGSSPVGTEVPGDDLGPDPQQGVPVEGVEGVEPSPDHEVHED